MNADDWPTLRAPGVNWLLCQRCGDFWSFIGHAQLVAHAWAQGIDECEDCLVEQVQQARSREQHPSRFWQRREYTFIVPVPDGMDPADPHEAMGDALDALLPVEWHSSAIRKTDEEIEGEWGL